MATRAPRPGLSTELSRGQGEEGARSVGRSVELGGAGWRCLSLRRPTASFATYGLHLNQVIATV